MGEMPNVDIMTKRSWKDSIEPIDSIDILDDMFREIDATGEPSDEYIRRCESIVDAWKKHFADKVKRIA